MCLQLFIIPEMTPCYNLLLLKQLQQSQQYYSRKTYLYETIVFTEVQSMHVQQLSEIERLHVPHMSLLSMRARRQHDPQHSQRGWHFPTEWLTRFMSYSPVISMFIIRNCVCVDQTTIYKSVINAMSLCLMECTKASLQFYTSGF